MKVELQCGDTITIPEGCKAIVKDGSVVFEREQKFKDGDVLVSVVNGHRHNAFIYESTDKKGFHSYYIGIDICGQLSFDKYLSCRWGNHDLSYATEEEKQALFDKMKEQGLKWNAEEKRVEKIRWRAKKGGDYYFIDVDLTVKSIYDTYSTFDNKLWNALNYFHTEEQAGEVARRMKEVLSKYHEEIGE
ncbi:hypothetical protein [Prevotella melaninogenica]